MYPRTQFKLNSLSCIHSYVICTIWVNNERCQRSHLFCLLLITSHKCINIYTLNKHLNLSLIDCYYPTLPHYLLFLINDHGYIMMKRCCWEDCWVWGIWIFPTKELIAWYYICKNEWIYAYSIQMKSSNFRWGCFCLNENITSYICTKWCIYYFQGLTTSKKSHNDTIYNPPCYVLWIPFG